MTTTTVGNFEIATKKRQWALKLHDCWQYKDFHGKSKFCPNFCPTSCICGNMMLGRLYTRLYEEKTKNCCDLGCFGTIVCLGTAPFGCEFPVLGNVMQGCVFCCCSMYLRERIKTKFNVEENEGPICCPGRQQDDWIQRLYFGMNFPCSLFQMYESILYWEAEEAALNGGNKDDNAAPSAPTTQENPVLAAKS